MDLRKTSMGSFMPPHYGTKVFPHVAKFTSPGTIMTGCQTNYFQSTLLPFRPDWNTMRNLPNISTELLKNEMSHMESMPTVEVTCIVGGFVGGNGPIPEPKFNSQPNHLWNLAGIQVNMCESLQTPVQPAKFDLNPPKVSFSDAVKETHPQVNCWNPGLSYAEVAKLPAVHQKKFERSSGPCRGVNAAKESTARKTAPTPGSHTATNSFRRNNLADSFRCKSDRINIPRTHQVNPQNQQNRRKSRKRRDNPLCKRELGTKKNHPKVDMDGSVWAEENRKIWQDEGATRSNSCGGLRMKADRTASFSSESECSPEVREPILCPRVRSLSECSAASVDSDDSFIVFECDDDAGFSDGSSEEDSSSDEQDETDGELCELTHPCGCGSSLREVNERWNRSDTGSCSGTRITPLDCCVKSKCSCPEPTKDKKKVVRFMRGPGLVTSKTLVVWDAAHRLARKGPWEAMARDRDRFNNRIHALSSVLSAVLQPAHRDTIYHQRFS